VGAAKVIACLALDEKEKKEIGRSPEIIKKLKECLLSKEAHVDTTKVAAKLLLLEYTNSEQLSHINLSIQEKNIILQEDQSFSLPTTALIEALDLDQLLPPWMQRHQTAVRNLDLQDVLWAERVNHCEAAAKALVVLTSGCEENAAAVLQEISMKEMEMIVEMLFPRDREDSRRRMYARLQAETFQLVKKITCAAEEDRVRATSVNAKLLQNLRAHGGTEKFTQQMGIIDQALAQVTLFN
jgi:D-ribose pyranose/furanose isomerase RbsD